MDPITLFGLTLTGESLFFFAVFLLSEWIGSNPRLSENTVSGLFLDLVKYLALGRNEDDKVKKIRDILRK
jgi:hypothetical protein